MWVGALSHPGGAERNRVGSGSSASADLDCALHPSNDPNSVTTSLVLMARGWGLWGCLGSSTTSPPSRQPGHDLVIVSNGIAHLLVQVGQWGTGLARPSTQPWACLWAEGENQVGRGSQLREQTDCGRHWPTSLAVPVDTPTLTGLEQGTVQPQRVLRCSWGTVQMTHWVPCSRWGGEPCPGPKNTKWAGQEDNHSSSWGSLLLSDPWPALSTAGPPLLALRRAGSSGHEPWSVSLKARAWFQCW